MSFENVRSHRLVHPVVGQLSRLCCEEGPYEPIGYEAHEGSLVDLFMEA